MNEDYDKDSGFRLAPRAMPCCGAPSRVERAHLRTAVLAFARFGFSIMNPNWRFMETLDSERAVDEMVRNLDWIRADQDEWRARCARRSVDLRAGEQRIAARLRVDPRCGIVIVYEHL